MYRSSIDFKTQTRMYFDRNHTKRPHRLILHKSEWCRLKKLADLPEEPSQQENEYIKGLIEKSQAWIKTWPDTVQGCVALREKELEKQRAKDIAQVNAFSKKKAHKDTAKSIQNAKQKIFDDSCYGRKLISALRESKVYEEREVQIMFMRDMKQKEAVQENKQRKSVSFCTFDLDKNSDSVEDRQKCNNIIYSKENKEMYERKKEEEAKAKEQEKLLELTDAQLMKYLLDREQETEDRLKLLERQALEQCAAEHRKTKEEREKWEAEYYANIEKCREEQEQLNCKIKQVYERMHKVDQDTALIKRRYELLKKCQDEKKKRYDDFVGKSYKIGEERAAKRERRQNDKIVQDRNKNITIAELNKKLAEYVRLRECSNKCFCDRQSLITKSGKDRGMKKEKDEAKPQHKEPRVPYFGPCNKLVAQLKQREKEPSPWTGAGAAHEMFAKNALKTLNECKYKIPTMKVIDEYMKCNALDAILPTSETK